MFAPGEVPAWTQQNNNAVVTAAGSGSGSVRGSSSYRDILSQMAASLKPGGDIYKSYMSDIDTQGKLLGSQLSASSIGRGLGNAQLGAGTQVFKHVTQAKAKARADLLGQYMSIMGNLAQLSFQEEQSNANRTAQTAGVSNASRGLDAFGSPMRGTLAEAQLNAVNRSNQPSEYPSLSAAAGSGRGTSTPAASMEYVSPFGASAGSPKSSYSGPTEIYSYPGSGIETWADQAPLKGQGQLASGEIAGSLWTPPKWGY